MAIQSYWQPWCFNTVEVKQWPSEVQDVLQQIQLHLYVYPNTPTLHLHICIGSAQRLRSGVDESYFVCPMHGHQTIPAGRPHGNSFQRLANTAGIEQQEDILTNDDIILSVYAPVICGFAQALALAQKINNYSKLLASYIKQLINYCYSNKVILETDLFNSHHQRQEGQS